jgi:arginine:ornithine antiporter/lysine permease
MQKSTKQKISQFQATAMSVNIMIGAGVLTGPSIMAARAGSFSFLGWGLAAIIFFPIVYCIARLPEIMPGPGGIYLYCKQGLGNAGGFLSGWLYFLCYNFAIAVLLSAFRMAMLVVFPDIWILKYKFIFMAASLTGIYCFNMLENELIARISSFLTYFKLIPVIMAIVIAPFFWSNATVLFKANDFWSVHETLPLAIFGFFGFEYACNISHLLKGKAATAKKVILSSFVFVAIVNTLFHLSLLLIMGTQGLIQFKASGYGLFVMQKLPLIANLLMIMLPITTMITYVNSSNGMMFLDSILLYTLAQDRMLRYGKWFRRINANGRPWFSVLVSSVFILFVGSVIVSTAQLVIACNLCIAALLFVAIIALLKAEQNITLLNKAFAYAALLATIFLVILNWYQIAATTWSRILALAPLLFGVLLGRFLFKPNKTLIELQEEESENIELVDAEDD